MQQRGGEDDDGVEISSTTDTSLRSGQARPAVSNQDVALHLPKVLPPSTRGNVVVSAPPPPPDTRTICLQDDDEEDEENGDSLVERYLCPRMDARFAKEGDPNEEPANVCEKVIGMLLYAPWPHVVRCLTAVLCLFLVFLALFLSQIDLGYRSCLTYWGYKANCDSSVYEYPTALLYCSSTRSSLQAAGAFGILSVLALIPLVGITSYQVFSLDQDRSAPRNRRLEFVILGIDAIIFLFIMIAWAAIAGRYSSTICVTGGEADKARRPSYGVGFGFVLTAWLMHLLASALPGALVLLERFLPVNRAHEL